MPKPLIYRLVALVLATNYFAFQVELFEEEYEANHRQVSRNSSVSSPSLTWESFDKENAPQPFIIDAEIVIECLLRNLAAPASEIPPYVSFEPVRDKSPPPVLTYILA